MEDTWITIALADVQASINNSELTAALSTALAGGQAAPLTVLIPDVTLQVRGYCANRNTLGPDGTVPQELKNAAIDIIIYRAACRVNKAMTEKKPAFDAAMQMLKDVSSGAMKISVPIAPTVVVTSAPSPAMPPYVRRDFGYNEERGI